MSDISRAGWFRRAFARLKGALVLTLGLAAASSAAAQEPAEADDFEARVDRLRARVAERGDAATPADALRELGVDAEGLGYWCKWSKWPNWCNWSNWGKWPNWGNWPNWCNW